MRPVTLRPYPEHPGRRPVALRPTLLSDLPFSEVALDSMYELCPLIWIAMWCHSGINEAETGGIMAE